MFLEHRGHKIRFIISDLDVILDFKRLYGFNVVTLQRN